MNGSRVPFQNPLHIESQLILRQNYLLNEVILNNIFRHNVSFNFGKPRSITIDILEWGSFSGAWAKHDL